MLHRCMQLLVCTLIAAIACFTMQAEDASAQDLASYYGAESGAITASGAPYDPMAFTAAHPWYDFGTVLEVCMINGPCVVVTVTDRGPYAGGRSIDLSLAAALAVGLAPSLGEALVLIRVL